MFKKLSSSFLIVSACIFSSCTPTVKQEIAILPTPVSLTEQSGSFVLKDGMKIGVSDQSLFPAAGYLQEILRNVISSSVEVTTDKSQVDMYFQLKDTVGKPGSYKLESTPEYIRVEATDYSGIISAIITIRQLLPATIEVQGEKQNYSIPVVQIEDAPRFEWRGFMLDASRHFWNKKEVKHVLDLMSLYKLNKFHWHLSDDQGWRIEIEKYPLLTEKGAWRKFNTQDRTCMARAKEEDNTDFLIPEDKIRIVEGDTLYGGYYTHDDIKEIVAYATQRGIDVIPEIDMPGHFLAAIGQYPELACDGLIGWGETFSSPICPGKDTTLEFCQNVFKEVFELFPYEYVHMGGDEVEKHLIKGVAGLLAHPGHHLYTVFPQYVQSLARHQGVGVVGPHHHPGDARLQNGVQLLVPDLVRLVLADAPALLQNLQCLVHVRSFLSIVMLL